jgi:hypothetical protein
MKLEKLGLITKDECEDTDIANITKEIADQVRRAAYPQTLELFD